MPKQPKYSKVFAAHVEPAEMAEYARIVWAETIAELDERDLITKPRLNTVDRYVRARTEYEFLYPIAMHEGPTLQKEGGGQFANMRYHAVAKLNEQIMKLEESLTLSPKSTGVKEEQVKSTKPLPNVTQKYLGRATAH